MKIEQEIQKYKNFQQIIICTLFIKLTTVCLLYQGRKETITNPEGLTIYIQSLQNRLLKVCYVPATSTSLPRLLFLLWPLTVLMKQTRQVVCTVKQSILLRCLWGWLCQKNCGYLVEREIVYLVFTYLAFNKFGDIYGLMEGQLKGRLSTVDLLS